MRVFISINGLSCGGAEKSLISFLNEIPEGYISDNELELDLLVLNKKDYFFTNVPTWVNWLDTDTYIDGVFESTKEILQNTKKLTVLIEKLLPKMKMKLKSQQNASIVQHVWNCWKDSIPMLDKVYDLAISYVDGFSNYYVIDKVKASKKILWVHNEYEKLNYNIEYDRAYFSKADAIVTISNRCVDCLKNVFPELKEKIWMIPNISSQAIIWNMSDEKILENIETENLFVSIGRLSEQKGFDLAIDAAELLSERIDFTWFIIGEGDLRGELEERIKSKHLQNRVFLIGNKSNPYPYIRKATVFVQPSRFEGKSIALDEAKILEKPIVVTNYTTAKDSIKDGENGYIVDFNAKALSDRLCDLVVDTDTRYEFSNKLHDERMSAQKDIDSYLHLIDTVIEDR